MSKPREFWIMGNKCHPHGHIVPDNYKKHGELYIEKSSADKLAEALEKVNKWRPNEFQDREVYEYGQQALKEYRGEK